MFKRRLLALVVSVTLGLPGLSMATLLPDNAGNLPSSFAEETTRSDTNNERLENTATISLTRKVNIFSRYKFPGVSFENAATLGLSAARPEPESRSLEKLVAIASLGEGVYSVSDGSLDEMIAAQSVNTGPAQFRNTGPTLRDMASVLVNKPASSAPPPQGGAKNNPASGFSLISSILETQLDDTFIDTASKVVKPTVNQDGLIALNFLGLRDFAFLVSPVNNKIQILDFRTGTTITISHSAHQNAVQDSYRPKGLSRSPAQEAHSQQKIIDLLKRLQIFASTFLLHPITLGALLLLFTCWGVLSISRRAD